MEKKKLNCLYGPVVLSLVVRGFLSETLKHLWPPGYNIVPEVTWKLSLIMSILSQK